MVTRRPAPKSNKPKSQPRRGRSARTSPTLDWILALSKGIPAEEQARHPVDGAAEKHHYLHGAAKQA